MKKRTKKLLVVLLLVSSPALAVSDPREMLANPVQEQRAEHIGSLLRCLVCQNESIEDSDADLARDLRAVVRRQVKDGRSDREIMAWMVARYGSFVQLKPPLSTATMLLWGTPFLAILIGAGAAMLGRRSQVQPQAPLSATEQTRLDELTRTA